MSKDPDARFCERCGHTMDQRSIEGKPRPYCPSCGYVAFFDPKVAAVVLVSADDKLVLVRRGI